MKGSGGRAWRSAAIQGSAGGSVGICQPMLWKPLTEPVCVVVILKRWEA
jgi:hypothetical protein